MLNTCLVLIILHCFFIVIGFLTSRRYFNPISLFNGVWLVSEIFFMMDISLYSNKLSSKTFIILLLFILVFNVVSLFMMKVLKCKELRRKKNVDKSTIKFIFYIWLFLSIIELFYCGNLPIFGYSYIEYGIPTLHGLVNSLAWVELLMIEYYCIDKGKIDNKLAVYFCFIIFYYILLLARQMLLTASVQMLVLYFMQKRFTVRILIYCIVIIFIGFVILGNIRTNSQVLDIVFDSSKNIPGYLKWFYSYLGSPIANFNAFVNSNYQFTYGSRIIQIMLPSFISNMFNGSNFSSSYLLFPILNTGTALLPIYGDFGIIGIILFSALLSIITAIFFVDRNNNYATSFKCAILLSAICFTFFDNLLLLLPIIFQFVLIDIITKFKIVFDKNNFT